MDVDRAKADSAGGENGRGERLTASAREHLELALESDDLPAARYHVRSALQALVIEWEAEPN